MSFATTPPAAAEKIRRTYRRIPGSGFIQRDFGLWMCLEQWVRDGLPPGKSEEELFHYEPSGKWNLSGLGWTEAAFLPEFPEMVLRDLGETEIVQDNAGRGVLCFKGRRQGFMPEYVSHPVTDMRSWQEQVKPRLQPDTPERVARCRAEGTAARKARRQGLFICQRVIGGYMYLRSLIGPEALLYAFYDAPELIHDCMRTWLELADAVTARHQQFVPFDEVFFGEDICYNHGPLISPDMMREFLFPYYQELLSRIRDRQPEQRELYIQLDTDGRCESVMDLYIEQVGCNVFSPFEVAAGSDVVAIGRAYPDLVLSGGFDKRILAAGPAAIDREMDRIFPVMFARGGYWPTCDHGIPAEVNWRDYLHFRKRCLEFA